MHKTVRKLLIGAALAGFVAGTTSAAVGSPAAPDGQKTKKPKIEKHCCKGQNSCKGQGGCGKAYGKNDCKGKGGCNTKGECKNHNTCSSDPCR
jgi:hypothetical protein